MIVKNGNKSYVLMLHIITKQELYIKSYIVRATRQWVCKNQFRNRANEFILWMISLSKR